MKFSIESKQWDYYKDQLTGFYNRFALLEYLEHNSSSRLTIFTVNIDNFSNINRMYGYITSDKILKEVAIYLDSLKLGDMIFFRFDGDEFVFVTSEFMNFREIEEFSRAVISFFNYMEIDVLHADEEFSLKISVSIGIAMGSGMITLNHAQMALQEARINAKSSYMLFTVNSKYTKQQHENIYWINKIKSAVEEERLIAYYQPIQNIKTGKIEKFECLARIKDDLTVISPIRFMEAARLTGSYSLITRSIIKNAFAEFSQTEYEFSINITASDIRLGYLEEFLLLHVKKFNIDPSRVVLELLEDIVTLSEGNIIQQINRLRELGFQIAIDDFGSENSNLLRLLEFHPDFLKIDGAFIKNIVENKQSQIIVDAIVRICNQTNIKVVAEFVASEEIYDYIKDIGIDYAQGFYIAKPLEHIEEVL